MKTTLTTLTTLAAITLGAALLAGGAHAQPAQYKIDTTHTKAMWEAKHFATSTNRGSWDKYEGDVTLDKAAKTGKVDLTIDMTSVNTGIAPFNAHLKKEDFFNVEKFPTARFVGDKFTFSGDKVTEVSGNLTMLGVTNPITLKAIGFNCYDNPFVKREVCGGDFEAIVKRSLFGLNWGLANKATSDEIKVTIQVEAVKQ
ncbi:MAG: YceI family protein [Burkholderiaceae bacterium]